MNGKVLDVLQGEKWVGSSTKTFKDVINPATREIIAKTPICTADEVIQLIKVEKKVFNRWRKTPAQTWIKIK